MLNKTNFTIKGQKVALTHLNKVLYPKAKFTKGDVIGYYQAISTILLPHLIDHPISMKRYPDGVDKEFFFEKNCPQYKPSFVKTATLAKVKKTTFCLINNFPSLIWMANLAALELHPLLAKFPRNFTALSLVFDLDPGKLANVIDCAQVALELKKFFDHLKLKSFVKTTGGKGLQVFVPLNTDITFKKTKEFAHKIALLFEEKMPSRVTSHVAKRSRKGKVYIDWLQNDPFKTTISVYSLRASEKPLVSTPLTWQEVSTGLRLNDPKFFQLSPDAVLKRIKKHGDLFKPILTLKQRLPRL